MKGSIALGTFFSLAAAITALTTGFKDFARSYSALKANKHIAKKSVELPMPQFVR
jgi:hypothetical protein